MFEKIKLVICNHFISSINFGKHYFMRAMAIKLRKIAMEISVRIVFQFILILKPMLQLSYDNRNPKDGSGAQLQRVLGVYCLSKYLKLQYVHNKIIDVSTHALDPFQDEKSRELFVKRVNDCFDFTSSVNALSNPVFILKLRLARLLKEAIRSKILNKPVLLSVVEPFGIIDFFPKVYGCLPNPNFGFDETVNSKFGGIVIHYRHGVGGFAKYHKQSIPRQLQDSYYLNCMKLLRQEAISGEKILLFTDAPLKPLDFTPPPQQIKNWVGSPNFDGEKIRIEKSEVNAIFLNSGLDIEIIHGGDPLEALAVMANARILFIGRSSLSYVGGLLNKSGKVIYPRSFWHSPLKGWQKING